MVFLLPVVSFAAENRHPHPHAHKISHYKGGQPIQNNAFSQDYDFSCTAAAIRTVMMAEQDVDEDESNIRAELEGQQGLGDINWNVTGIYLVYEGSYDLYLSTMQNTLANWDLDYSYVVGDGTVSNVMTAIQLAGDDGVAIVQTTSTVDGVTGNHTVTAQYNFSTGVYAIDNPIGQGGTVNLTSAQMSAGSFTVSGITVTINVSAPVLVPTP